MTASNQKFQSASLVSLACLLGMAPVFAHVPYIEGKDYPEGQDFIITDVEQSKAFYAYLEANDSDGFKLVLDEPGRIYVSTLIPFCREYAYYDVNFALIGAGLPAPDEDLPFEVPEGQGAIVHIAHFKNWAERPFMYEMFSARRYFDGRSYTYRDAPAGTYRFVIWHQEGKPGDYTAIIGRSESFGAADMKLSFTNLPAIQDKEEMRGECESEGDFSKWFDREVIPGSTSAGPT